MKNLENDIEKLKMHSHAFEQSDSGNESGFAKKIGRKRNDGNTLADFGTRQNEFNAELIETIASLKNYCMKLEAALENETQTMHKTASAMAAMKKELDTVRLRSTLNSNQIEKMDGGLGRFSEKLENYALNIAPGARLADCPKGCKEADIADSIGYFDKIEALKNAHGDRAKTADFEKFCINAVNRELDALSAYDEIIIDFYGNSKYAAVLYGNLSRSSIYKINRIADNDDPKGHFSIICCDNIKIPKRLMLKSGLILITGNSPFEGCSEDEMSNLRFLNDCGLHSYLTISEAAYEQLTGNGFRCVSMISPDKLMHGFIVKYAEKGMESAVPAGAVSMKQFMHTLESTGQELVTDPTDFPEFNRGYPYDCLDVIEKSTIKAVENHYFQGENISKCLISETSEGIFNVINGMNFMNHLDYDGRKKVYARVKTMLESGGLFVFNGFDAVIGIKLRAVAGWDNFPVYEALWTREQLISELEENGFKIKFLIPAGTGLFDMLPPKYRKSPAERIVGVTV
ncbi:hypothetical protein [Porcipelethomonas sp.]|uniref:hypothetical protein n=1 Tax=Porcipelethomonas sp. TaxID=2981675 RepID=UPI003EF6FA34